MASDIIQQVPDLSPSASFATAATAPHDAELVLPEDETGWCEIAVYRTAAAGFFCLADGRPVWPVTSEEEFATLKAILLDCGVDLREVDSSELRPSAPELRRPGLGGLVVAYGAGQLEAARLYAHLTGRSWLLVRGLSELPDPCTIAVLILAPENLRCELLDRIYGIDGESAPGILYGFDDRELTRQVLARAAHARAGGRYPRVYTEFSSSRVSSEEQTQEVAGEARQRLRQPVELLTAVAHSNGLDAGLAPQLVACPLDPLTADAPQWAVDRCRESGTCAQLGTTLAEARANGKFASASDFRARIIVWSVCYGIVDADGPIDRRSSFVDQLIRRGSTGAVVTSWNLTWQAERVAKELTRSLLQGETVGAAVGRVNGGPEIAEKGARVCILGDPSLRIHGSVEPETSPRRHLPTNLTAPLPNGDEDPGTLLEYSLHAFLARYPQDKLGVAAKKAAAHAVVGVTSRERDLAQLHWLLQRGRLVSFWSAVSPAQFETGTCPYPECRGATVVGVFKTALEPDPRVVAVCPRCRMELDAPCTYTPILEVHNGRELTLTPAPPQLDGVAGVRIWGMNASDGVSHVWPKGADGNLSPIHRLDEVLPTGVTNVTAGIVAFGSYLTIKRCIRIASTSGARRAES